MISSRATFAGRCASRALSKQSRMLPPSLAAVSVGLESNRPILSAHRFKSSAAAPESCPFHAPAAEASDKAAAVPKLTKVPALPFLGSLLIPAFSGMEKYEFGTAYDFWAGNRRRFGDFYEAGFPGLGSGVRGMAYILTDPNEFHKVLRKEGPMPYGAVQSEWPFIEFFKDQHSPMEKFFGRGEEWKKLRRFMQTDLLSPQAAKGYVPGMVEAARLASAGLDRNASDVNTFMARASFDLFSTVVFGELTNMASGDSKDEKNLEFCDTTQNALESLFPIMIAPETLPLKKLFNIKTAKYQFMEDNFTRSRELAFEKMREFRERKQSGSLTEAQAASYASLAIDRQALDGDITDEEVAEIVVLALSAAIDTTSAVLSWCLCHLAMNPDVQEKLYQEVSRNIAADKVFTEDMFTKAKAPYLHAILRENHRISPPIPISLVKDNAVDDVEIHGVTIPKDNKFILDARSVGMDETLVEDVDAFRPERWLDDAVQGRVGTRAEILDHPLYRDPFSAGARKCPGSRVANYEALVMLSQICLDWNVTFADEAKYKSWRDITYNQGLTVQPTVPPLVFKKRV